MDPIAITDTAPSGDGSKPERGSRRQTLAFWGLGLLLIAAIAAAAAGPVMSNVEQPEYKVVSAAGSIEIRNYAPMITAEAEVQGERKSAIEAGFRLVAAYIFGANEPNAKISMTAPVEQQAKQTIAMTAPVTQQSSGDSWSIRFIMPRQWTMETLPVPADPRVKLVPLPVRRFVAIRFSGSADEALIAQKTAELKNYVQDQGLPVAGTPVLAFYNPPWTLPFLRRNEIMLEIARG